MDLSNVKRLPILPNHDFVALPDLEMELHASNAYDKNLLSKMHVGDEFVISYANTQNVYGDFDEITLPGVRTVGCICRVANIIIEPQGIKCRLIGKTPADLSEFDINEEEGWVDANVQTRNLYERDTNQIYKALADFVNKYTKCRDEYPALPEIPDFTQSVGDPNNLPYHVCAFLMPSANVCQQVLEARDPSDSLHILERDLEKYNLDSKLEYDLNRQVSQNIDRGQKEYLLREKMKVIREQLKEYDGEDKYTMYEKTVNEHPELYPENIQKRIRSELSRLSTMAAGNQEANVIQNYLDLMIELPWRISSTDVNDLNEVKATLDKNHYGLEKQKDRILQYLAVKQMTNSLKAPILCFYGAPGVGKTSLAISIAEALGRKFTKVALGGINDEAEIRGHRRTYVAAMPGKIISSIQKCGTNNPVFLLDEIDKVGGGGYHGDPASALLEVLDPEQNSFFQDNFLDEPFDLSNVLFICTANDISRIPGPLFDRLEMIELNTYTKSEKLQIAKTYLIPGEEKDNGIKEGMMTWTDDAIDYITEYYTREAGVRQLRRHIGTVDRKFAVSYLSDPENNAHIDVTPEVVTKSLGAEIFTPDIDINDSQVGVINGLAYTDAGGCVLKIEVNTFPGRGSLILTGNLGDVMKEACETALSYVKSIGNELGINPEFFTANDVHIHFPESATPKDGPSAGCATALCIISAICQVKIRNDVAMTGEIDLRGNSMPIGGLREKTNAASKEHIKTVFIPKANHKDALEIPKEIADTLNIVEVKTVKEMFSGVFLEDISKKKRKIASLTSPKKPANETKENNA